MTERKLTPRQHRVLRAMSHSWEPAADIASRAQVDNRGIGGVLLGLHTTHGLIQRRNRASDRVRERVSEWRLK